MSPRKGLVGLMGIIGLMGQAGAAPPPDPIAAEKPVGGHVSPLGDSTPRAGAWLVLSAIVWDVVLDRFTAPLGTAEMSDRNGGCGG